MIRARDRPDGLTAMTVGRRQFISVLGGATLAWPLAARTQQPKIFRLGYLDPDVASEPTARNLRRQFLLGLRDLGDIEGRDFRVEDRNADGILERLPVLAADLANLPVDIIVTAGDAAIHAAMQASDKIPIVMTISGDPIGSGIIASLARPGGNVTGMSALASEMTGKRLELLKEMIPRASRLAVLWNPSNKSKIEEWKNTQTAAKATGLTLISVEARSSEEIEAAFGSILRERPDAMITLSESLMLANRERIGHFALSNRLPMFAETRELAVAGGLASYGASRPDLWRRAASYVDKIMRGANPSDIPVEQPVRFELVINLKTAKAIDLDVPPMLLGRADEVIE
jgi:putative tryptophan/tyrosine transport system substrate-binding protein